MTFKTDEYSTSGWLIVKASPLGSLFFFFSLWQQQLSRWHDIYPVELYALLEVYAFIYYSNLTHEPFIIGTFKNVSLTD